MNHVLAQLFTNSREHILAALNTLQRRSYDPDFDLSQYPHALDHLMAIARNVWITVSEQQGAPFAKEFVPTPSISAVSYLNSYRDIAPFTSPSHRELLSANRAGLLNLPDFSDGPVQVLITILNILRNLSFGAHSQAILANHTLVVDLLANLLLVEPVVRPPCLFRADATPNQVLSDIGRRLHRVTVSRNANLALGTLLACKPDVDIASTKESIATLALEVFANIVHLIRFSTLPLPTSDGSSDFRAADNEGQLTESGLMIKKLISKLVGLFVPAKSAVTSVQSEQFALEAVTIIATNPHSRLLFNMLLEEDRTLIKVLCETCDKLANMTLLDEHQETRFWAAGALQSLMDNAMDPRVVVHMCQDAPYACDTLVVALEKNTQRMIRELALGASLLDENEAVAARDLASLIAMTMTRMCSVVDVQPDLLVYEDRLVGLSLGCPRGTLAERLGDLVTALMNSRTEETL